MPSCAAIRRLRCCNCTEQPLSLVCAWRNSHSAQRASASLARRLTANSVCWRCARATSINNDCSPSGLASIAARKSAKLMRRNTTSVSATASTTLARFSTAVVASSQPGPSVTPSWCSIKPSIGEISPSTTRPDSTNTTESATADRCNSTVPGATVSVGRTESKGSMAHMVATVPRPG